MRPEEFQQIIKFRLGACLATLAQKAPEYATPEDPFHNFHRAASILGCSPARALVGMWTKHLVSILDMVELASRGEKIPEPLLEEKITDAICYLVLLEAMLKGGQD